MAGPDTEQHPLLLGSVGGAAIRAAAALANNGRRGSGGGTEPHSTALVARVLPVSTFPVGNAAPHLIPRGGALSFCQAEGQSRSSSASSTNIDGDTSTRVLISPK